MKTYSEVLIISEDLLKLYSPLSENISINKLLPFAQIAQNLYIQPLLGVKLMETLQQAIAEEELTPELKALIIKIAPPLAFYTQYLGLRSLAYSTTQKGLTKEKSENSEPITEKELGEYELDLKNKAELTLKLLEQFLCECGGEDYDWAPKFPCDCEKYKNEDEGYKVDTAKLIYFPKKKKGCKKCGD